MKLENKENQHNVKSNGRNIFLTGTFTEELATEIVQELIRLQNEDPLTDITIIIDSFGGCVYALNAVLDCMEILSCDIRTIVVGKAMSAGAKVAIHGTKGKRFMTRRSFLMLHQMSSGIFGDTKSMENDMTHIRALQNQINVDIAKASNLSEDEVKTLIDRELWLSPKEAIEYGFIDGVITSIK